MPRRIHSKPLSLPEQIVSHPSDLAGALEHLAQSPIIAFDTEFVGEDAYRPELCLVQVATPERLYVIDPFTCGPLDGFWTLLIDPTRTVVAHAGREDIRICHFAIGSPPPGLFDLQIAAGLVGMGYPVGYAALVMDLLGHRMHKGETLTDWRRRPLTPDQVRYAFDDVRYLIPAWQKLSDRLQRHTRETWAKEEFASFIRRAVADDLTIERWRKIKGLGALDRRGLAIAREVFTWRDSFAESVNRPPRTLLRDDLLTEIARRAPSRLEELRALRGFSGSMAEPILKAVQKGKQLPQSEWPEVQERDNDPPNVVLLANLLGVVLTDLCTRKELTPSLCATGQDLKALVRSRVAKAPLPEIALTRGWRAKALLPELLAVLDGRDTVRVVKPRSSAPLAYGPADEG